MALSVTLLSTRPWDLNQAASWCQIPGVQLTAFARRRNWQCLVKTFSFGLSASRKVQVQLAYTCPQGCGKYGLATSFMCRCLLPANYVCPTAVPSGTETFTMPPSWCQIPGISLTAFARLWSWEQLEVCSSILMTLKRTFSIGLSFSRRKVQGILACRVLSAGGWTKSLIWMCVHKAEGTTTAWQPLSHMTLSTPCQMC